MNIRKQPYAIDFIGNRPEYVIRTSPNYTDGRKHYQSWMFTHLNTTSVILTTPYFTLTWVCNSVESTDPYRLLTTDSISSIVSQFQSKIVNNEVISQYYDISASVMQVSGGSVALVEMTAKSVGASSTITWTQSPYPHQTMCSEYATTQGVDVEPKSNYRVVAKFNVSYEGNTYETPAFHLYDNNGSVHIPVEILSPYFTVRDIPDYGEQIGALVCSKAMMQIQLLYAESIDGVQESFSQTSFIRMLNGTIDQYCRDNNMPDWTAANDEKFYRKTIADVFGQNNNATVLTDIASEQYLYLSNFTDNAITSVAVTLTTNHNGTTATTTAATITLPAKSIVRIPVGVAALSIANTTELTAYTVSVSVSQSLSITRNFIIRPRPYNAQTALLLNRVGLYESFIFDNVAEEGVTEGETVMLNHREHYLYSSHRQRFTARTGLRTEKELELLRSALHRNGNLLIDGEYAWKISIEPSSVTIVDRREDMLSVEVSFLKTERINRRQTNIGTIETATVITRTDNIIRNS